MLGAVDAPTNFRDVLRRSPGRLRGELPPPITEKPLRILFVTSAHNSLSQRAYIALTEMGHEVTVQVVDSPELIEASVLAREPDLVVCPMLKQFIPESVWRRYTCLVVHPGPHGDRGPSSLDWAIELGMDEWGVTVLEAVEEADAGDIWETRKFKMRPVGKSTIYRQEVRTAAVEMLVFAVHNFARGDFKPLPLDYDDPNVTGRLRPLIRQADRAIDWRCDSTAAVVRKIRAAEGHPGVLDTIAGAEFFLFNVYLERGLRGRPGEIIATRNGAICRATVDGAVWITHLKAKEGGRAPSFKLPAIRALELAGHTPDVPEIPVALHAPIPPGHTYREVSYEEKAGVGYLNFDFYNGAMSTEQCRRLRDAYLYARIRPTKVIVLAGGADFFSNGIHLNVIEAAADQAEESWYNLHAIDDVVREIIETDSHITISALSGDAAAGGVPLAVSADHAVAREDVVLNPYYQHMGGLYGSEYWTYLLPRRVGAELAAELTSAPFEPIGTRRAVDIGLLDAAFGDTVASFRAQVQGLAERLARHPDVRNWLEQKRRLRALDEQFKPLAAYRTEEMARSHECFFGEDRSYHVARSRFVYKTGAPCQVKAALREPELTEAQRAVTKVRQAKQSAA